MNEVALQPTANERLLRAVATLENVLKGIDTKGLSGKVERDEIAQGLSESLSEEMENLRAENAELKQKQERAKLRLDGIISSFASVDADIEIEQYNPYM